MIPSDNNISSDCRAIVIRDNISSEDDCSTTKSVEEHPCYDLLLGRKQVVKLKSYRIGLITNILATPKDEYLDSTLHNDPNIIKWYQVYSTVDKRKKQWSVSVIAHALCEFDTFYHVILRLVPWIWTTSLHRFRILSYS